MEKKKVIFSIVIILILLGIVALREYSKFKENSEILQRGIGLLDSNTEEGLRLCESAEYGSFICYVSIVIPKMVDNETFPSDYCEKIDFNPKDYPFWVRSYAKKDIDESNLIKIKKACLDYQQGIPFSISSIG